MPAPPLPKEGAHLGRVRPARYIFERAVVDRENGLALERLAVRIGQADLECGLFARPVGLLSGEDLDVQHTLFGRDRDLAHLRVEFSVVDGQRLDEEVRHVLGRDRDLLDRALALGPEEPRRQRHPAHRPDEKEHRRPLAVGVHHEAHRLAREVFGLVRNQLELGEAEAFGLLAGPAHGEDVAPLDRLALGIGQGVGEPVLSGPAGLDLDAGLAGRVGVEVPAFDLGLDRLAGARLEPQEFERPTALHGLLIQALGLEPGGDGVARAVMAAVDPGIDLERLAADEGIAPAHDRAAREVAHLGLDRIAVVAVAVKVAGEPGVDRHLEAAVLADRRLAFGHDLRPGLRPLRPPAEKRPPAAPALPARKPVVIVGEPPIAPSVKPVPAEGGVPAGIVIVAQDFILDRGLGDRCAEIVARLDHGLDLLAEAHRLGGRLDQDLEFGLLVLLHPERLSAHGAAQAVDDAVDPERGVRRQLEFGRDPAEFVRREALRKHLLVAGALDGHAEAFPGKRRFLVAVVLGLAGPQLEVDRVLRPVNRPVGHDEGLDLVVLGIGVIEVP